MHLPIRLLATTTLLLTLSACDDDESDNTNEAQLQTGVIQNSLTQNIGVTTPSVGLQLTNAKGEFQYRQDEICEMSVSGVPVATAKCQSIITPKHLTVNEKTCDDGFLMLDCVPQVNLARLLQSIDTDSSLETLTIPELDDAGKEMLAAINYDRPFDSFAADSNVQALVSQFNGGSLKSPEAVIAHLTSPAGGLHAADRSFIDKELIDGGRHYITLRHADGTSDKITIHFNRDNTLDMWQGHTSAQAPVPEEAERFNWKVQNGIVEMDNGLALRLKGRAEAGNYRLYISNPEKIGIMRENKDGAITPSTTNGLSNIFDKLAQAIVYAIMTIADAQNITINESGSDAKSEFTKEELENPGYWYTTQVYQSLDDTDINGRYINLLADALGLTEGSPYITYYAINNQDDPDLPLSSNCPQFDPIGNTSTQSNLKIGVITIRDYLDLSACYVSFTDLATKILSDNCVEFAGENASTYCDENGNANALTLAIIPSVAMTYEISPTGSLTLNEATGFLQSYLTRFEETISVSYKDDQIATGNLACVETQDNVSSLGDCSTTEDTTAVLFKGTNNTDEDPAFLAATRVAQLCAAQSSECPLTTSGN